MDDRDIIDQQGWNDDTMLMLAQCFIESQGLGSAYADYLQRVADEENAEFAASYDLMPGDRVPGLFDPDQEPIVECPICGHWHPAGFTGDCRDDANRFPMPID